MPIQMSCGPPACFLQEFEALSFKDLSKLFLDFYEHRGEAVELKTSNKGFLRRKLVRGTSDE